MSSLPIKCKSINPKMEYLINKDNILGKGTYGMVYEVQSRESGDLYAIKMVDFDGISPEERRLNLRETDFLSRLKKSPYILHLKDCFYHKNKMFSILDLASGSLRDYVLSSNYIQYSESLTFKIFEQLVYAVRDCHSSDIVHRDIKLENFLIKTYISGIPKVLLSDFGLSASNKPGELLNDFPGSPHYVPPELFNGIPYDGRQDDIWALGVCLYLLYNVRYPFDGGDQESPQFLDVLSNAVKHNSVKFHPDTPAELVNLINWCLTKTPKHRPSIYDIISSTWFSKNGKISDAIVKATPDFWSLSSWIAWMGYVH